MELGTASSVRSEILSSENGSEVVRRRVFVTETPFGRCCPQITVPADMVCSASDHSSRSHGTFVSHVYRFQLVEGGCVCTGAVDISKTPPCSSWFVIPVAKRAHTRTMDALAQRFSGGHGSEL